MTHSGGKQHAVGYNGQQFEVSFFDLDQNRRRVLGWTNDSDAAKKMADGVEKHPIWTTPWVTDLFATQQHGGHPAESAVVAPNA